MNDGSKAPHTPTAQAGFAGYCRGKARLLGTLGVERYRAEDFYSKPAEDLEESSIAGLLHGCAQMLEGQGFALATPLKGVSVRGCYALIDTLHFDVVDRTTHYGDAFVDELRCRHRVTRQEGILFNQAVLDE